MWVDLNKQKFCLVFVNVGDLPSYMSLVVLSPSVSVLLSSVTSPSESSVSRVKHTSSLQTKPQRQCCSPAGGKISALTLYNVCQQEPQRVRHVQQLSQSLTIFKYYHL